jgi:hypothetical protein
MKADKPQLRLDQHAIEHQLAGLRDSRRSVGARRPVRSNRGLGFERRGGQVRLKSAIAATRRISLPHVQRVVRIVCGQRDGLAHALVEGLARYLAQHRAIRSREDAIKIEALWQLKRRRKLERDETRP